MPAVVGDVGFGPHGRDDLDRLPQHPDAVGRRVEVVAVPLELVFVPPGTDPPDQATARHHVDVRGDLRQQRRRTVRRAPDHLPELDAARPLRDRCHRGPALEHCLVRRPRHVVEVVVHPQRVEPEVLGERRDLDRLGPLVDGIGNGAEFHLPSLGHEHTELQAAHLRMFAGSTTSRRRRPCSEFNGPLATSQSAEGLEPPTSSL